MATELAKIFVDEVSGVDAPANQTPGWLMTKAAAPALAAAVADAEAADLTVTKDEVGAVRRFLAGLRKSTSEEIDMTKDELLEILDARDAKLAKSASDAEAEAAARAEEIKAEAERLAAEKLAEAEAAAVAEAERVAAEAAAAAEGAEGTEGAGETTTTTEPTLVTAEEFSALSDRVEALVKAIAGEDGNGGLAGAVSALLNRSAVSAQVAEAPGDVSPITKSAEVAHPLLAMRGTLRETWQRGNGASATIGDGKIS